MLFILTRDILLNVIFDFLDVVDVIRLKSVCKWSEGVEFCKNVYLVKSKVRDGNLGMFRRGETIVVKMSKNINGLGMIGLRFERIRVLDLGLCFGLVDNDVKRFVNIEVMRLPRCSSITNDGVKELVKMRKMDLSTSLAISDEGVKNMVEMEDLRMFFNRKLTIEGIRRMTKLRVIMMAYNQFIGFNNVKEILPLVKGIILRNP